MNLPMDVEHDFKWNVCQPRKQKNCEYLSPIKRNRIDLDCTEIIKYIPKNIKDIKKPTYTKLYKKTKSISFSFLYKHLFHITDFMISTVLLYFLFQLCYFLQKDILHKIHVKKYELHKLVENAVNNYKINKCDLNTRVPALNDICNKWECIIKNGSIKYTSVIFEVLGDVCNGFIDRVSWKSLGVIFLFLIIYLKFRK